MKKQINIHFFQVHEIYIIILIKFNIDISNDELFKTIWKHKKKNKTVDCHS